MLKSPTNITTAAGTTPMNGLTRSRRSHFSRKDSTPEQQKSGSTTVSGVVGSSSVGGVAGGGVGANREGGVTKQKVVHEYERLLFYSKLPQSCALPRDWNKIIDKYPLLIRNKVKG